MYSQYKLEVFFRLYTFLISIVFDWESEENGFECEKTTKFLVVNIFLFVFDAGEEKGGVEEEGGGGSEGKEVINTELSFIYNTIRSVEGKEEDAYRIDALFWMCFLHLKFS